MAGLGRAFVWVGDLVGLDCKDLENRLDLALLSWRFGLFGDLSWQSLGFGWIRDLAQMGWIGLG